MEMVSSPPCLDSKCSSFLFPNLSHWINHSHPSQPSFVNVQIFVRVGSPMIRPLLDFALTSAAAGSPYRFQAFSFWKLCDQWARGSGFNYLIDYAARGVKRASKATRSVVSCRKRSRFFDSDWIRGRANRTAVFAARRKMWDWTISVNGEFIADEAPAEHLKQRIPWVALRLQFALQGGVSAALLNVCWLENDCLKIVNASSPPAFPGTHGSA
jgi:hypothetical protein